MEIKGANKQELLSVWETNSLGELCQISAGGDLDKDDFSSYLTNTCFYPIFSNGLEGDGLYGYSAIAKNKANAITITARGTVGFARFRSTKFTPIGRLLVLYPKSFIDAQYLSYFINERVSFVSETTGVPQLTAPQASKYLVSYPPLKEQKAIAEALSDADALITSLEKLLNKKTLIYNTALNELCVHQFEEVCQTKSLGELFEITSSIRVHQKDWKDSGVPFLRTRELVKHHSGRGLNPKIFISEELFGQLNKMNGSPKIGDLLVSGVGTIGIPFEVKSTQKIYFKDANIIWLKNKGLVNASFISFLFETSFLKNQILSKSIGTTVNTFTIDRAKKTYVFFPTIEKQKEVSNILFDMKVEIRATEDQLNKARRVKEGMMQKLLTGKTRLI